MKNKYIIYRTRSIFSQARKGVKKDDYGIEWNLLVDSLKPFPVNLNPDYNIDHIIPLTFFNFIHVDGSLNLTELKKAWSPANLRVLKKVKNLSKSKHFDIVSNPLRFEFVFENKEKVSQVYKFFSNLHKKEWNEFKKAKIW